MLKTWILDSIYHSNTRSEFHIPSEGRALLPDLRLAELGTAAKDAQGAATTDAQYLYNGGILNSIKSVTLLSNSEEISVMRDANRWLAFQNLLRTTESMQEITGHSNGSNIALKTNSQSLDFDNWVTDSNSVKGKLNLGSVMGYLQSVPLLADVKNLRLVIEWNTAVGDVFASQYTTPISFTVNQPVLIYDEYLGSDVAQQINAVKNQPVVFREYDVERLTIPVVANGITQTTDQRLRAFDNKSLRRVLIMTDNTTANNLLGHNRSTAMNGEKWNLRVNGKTLMQFNGLDNPNKKALHLDNWGKMSVFNGSQLPRVHEEAAWRARPGDLIGQFSYMSLQVEQKINELDLVYTRVGSNVQPQFLESVDLYVFGEVSKFVKRGPQGLQMGYTS